MPLPKRLPRRQLPIASLTFALLVTASAFAQQAPPPPRPNPLPQQNQPGPGPGPGGADPGPRALPADAGGPLQNLSTDEWNFFGSAFQKFGEIASVSGTIAGQEGRGLGPRFNLNSCAGCHAYPSVGGTSPPQNPQVAVATLNGARNVVPSFITATGPVRVARFVNNADGTPDGGVHALFTISGRSDAQACNAAQPDFPAALAANNVIFRIPTPLYGLGLVESTPDANLRAALSANAALKTQLGVRGHFNTNPNDGTITRFGWKAQNKSLTIFSGEAYNVEMGVTNEIFPNEREDDPTCQLNATPEDAITLDRVANVVSTASAQASDSTNFAMLSRLFAAPTAITSAAATRGEAVFNAVGCQTCHVSTLTTGRSQVAALNNVAYRPFSDFALHDMGQALNDRVTQGDAGGRDWRTAPLWGLGQRLFFLHDGRTSDLVTAITTHASQGSEASGVVVRFNQLTRQDTADLLAFLRSL